MDPKLAAILATVALTLLALAITLLGHQRGRGPRHLVAGIGWSLVPFGLWLTGVMGLLVNGLRSVATWLNRTVMDTQHWIGVIVAGLGVLLVLASLAIRPRTREQAREIRAGRRQPATAGGGAAGRELERPASADRTPVASQQSRSGSKPALDDEDAEIEALLKKRGIQ